MYVPGSGAGDVSCQYVLGMGQGSFTVEMLERGWLRRERAELVGLLRDLGEADWARPTECPAWTVKQVALHLLGDDLSLLSRQRDAGPQGLILYAEDHPGDDFRQLLDGFNEQWVTASTFISTDLVTTLLELTGEWTATFYETVDLASLGEPVGFFGSTESSPYWQIAGREFVERWVHQHQIRRAVAAPDLGDDALAAVGTVFVTSIAMRLEDLGVQDGARIGITIADVASWTLTWRASTTSWELTPRATGGAEATVEFAAPTAVRLFSRGPVAPEIADVITTSGDGDLGASALVGMGRLFS